MRLARVYTIASGKGGTGKTTVAVNLGSVLAHYGKKTCIIDADLGAANIGLMLGLEKVAVTLHDVLAGTAHTADAIYDGPCGAKVIPCSLSLQGYRDADPDLLKDVITYLSDRFDIVVIDAPPGITRDSVVPLALADEVILVVNPDLSSAADTLKAKILADMTGTLVRGAIFNRTFPETDSLTPARVEEILGVGVIGTIPEDPDVRRSSADRALVVVKYPSSPASLAFRHIALELVGIEAKEMEAEDTDVEAEASEVTAPPPRRPGLAARFVRVVFRRRRKQE